MTRQRACPSRWWGCAPLDTAQEGDGCGGSLTVRVQPPATCSSTLSGPSTLPGMGSSCVQRSLGSLSLC